MKGFGVGFPHMKCPLSRLRFALLTTTRCATYFKVYKGAIVVVWGAVLAVMTREP